MKVYIFMLICVLGLSACDKTGQANTDLQFARHHMNTKNVMGNGNSQLKPGEHLGGI